MQGPERTQYGLPQPSREIAGGPRVKDQRIGSERRDAKDKSSAERKLLKICRLTEAGAYSERREAGRIWHKKKKGEAAVCPQFHPGLV